MNEDDPVVLSHKDEKRPLAERMKDAEARLPGFLAKTKLIHMDLLSLGSQRSQFQHDDVLLFFYKYNIWIGPSTDLGLLDWLHKAAELPDKGLEILMERMLDKEEELFALFSSADVSGNGQIDPEELRRLSLLVLFGLLCLNTFGAGFAFFAVSRFRCRRRTR